MSRTLLQICNHVLLLSSVDEVSQVVDEGTAEVERLHALANDAVEDIMEWAWTELRKRHEFTLSEPSSGNVGMEELPDDFLSFIPETTFTDDHVIGADNPTTPQFRSYLQSVSGGSVARYNMWLQDGKLYVFEPDAGQTVSFEYQTNTPVAAVNGTAKTLFTADDDTFRLHDQILIKELRWRYCEVIGDPTWERKQLESRAYMLSKLGDSQSAKGIIPTDGGGGDVTWGEPFYNPIRPPDQL